MGEGPVIPLLGDVVRSHARERADAIALSFEGRVTSYGELDRRSNRVAHALSASGVRRGDRIAWLGRNADRYFELLVGAAKLGVVLTPVGWRLAPPEVAWLLENCGARLLFVDRDTMTLARSALERHSQPPPMITVDASADGRDEYAQWRDAAPADEVPGPIASNDVLVQLYTSGTTGRPKGAMLTHANVLGVWCRCRDAGLQWANVAVGEASLVAMPVAHIGGTGWGIVGLLGGARLVVHREFLPAQVLEAIASERLGILFAVPAALQALVRLPRAREIDRSSLRCILYGASPIATALLRECLEVFACEFCQLYGLTETSGAIVQLPPQDHDPRGSARMAAAGIAMPGVELRILDAQGRVLPPRVTGHIATRSSGNMLGYHGLPAETAATLTTDGWLLTGDAGYLDEDGYLYIQDRIKDLIVTGAENVYPTEVENAIYGHPAIAEVAVIGVPDERWGEAVKALVVAKPGALVDPADVIAWARERIAGYKLPKSIEVVASLPRNASGKLLRRELREPYWVGRERRVN